MQGASTSHRATAQLVALPPNTTHEHTRRANRQRKPRDSWTRTSNAADTPHQPPSQPPSHVAACHGRCGAGAGPDRPRPRERARASSGGSRSRGLAGDRRPSRVPRAPSRCARRPRSPRQQQLRGAAWRERRSCARSWGAGARRWARRARSAHAVRTCRPRRLAARACGGLGWRSSRASTEARRTRGRRERVSQVVGPSRGVEEDRVAARRPLRPTFRWTTLRGPPPEWATLRDRFPRRRLGPHDNVTMNKFVCNVPCNVAPWW